MINHMSRSIKMVKSLQEILRFPLYIRKIEVSPIGWNVDAIGDPDQINKLAQCWRVTFSVEGIQDGLTHIKGRGVW